MARRFLIDSTPMRESHDFRLLFVGQLVNMFGSQLTMVAIPFEVFALTRSSFQVDAVSLAQVVPLIAGALIGGSLGDAFDRRLVLPATTLALAATSGVLALNASLAHPSLLSIYLVSAVAAVMGGAYSTAASSAVPVLVGAPRLVAAFAAMQVVDQAGMVVGPALSGLLIATLHLQWVFALDALTFVGTALTVVGLSPIPPTTGAHRPGLRSIAEGLRYIRSRQVLLGVYLIDLNAILFGAPRALFPALALTVFHGGPTTLGFLYAAPGVGALAGALTMGWLADVRRPARAVVVAVCVWGAAIAAFGVVSVLWGALV